jgi:hypothetical protein
VYSWKKQMNSKYVERVVAGMESGRDLLGSICAKKRSVFRTEVFGEICRKFIRK